MRNAYWIPIVVTCALSSVVALTAGCFDFAGGCEGTRTCSSGGGENGGTPIVVDAMCGNGIIEDGEDCDGVDLAGASCQDVGYGSPGSISCKNCKFDTSKCVASCDGQKREPGEDCDGDDFGGQTCQNLGFVSAGTLKCNLCKFDPQSCKSECNNGKLEPGEVCDGEDLGGHNCSEMSYANPNGATCTGNCELDFAKCTFECGNGIQEPGECEGDPPAGQECTKQCNFKYSTVINEVVYNTSDSINFIELKGDPELNLSGYSVHFMKGYEPGDYFPAVSLNGMSIGKSGYFVFHDKDTSGIPNNTSHYEFADLNVHNGPNSVVLMKGSDVVDAVGYGNFGGNIKYNHGEGQPAIGTNHSDVSLSRMPDGEDTDNNDADFEATKMTPGAKNE